MNKANEAQGGSAIPTSELERWLATRRIRFDVSIVKPPDFLRKRRKEQKDEWPLLAAAARHPLSVSDSKVDVEGLFGGCRDEFGIRGHLTLSRQLRSAYTEEDKMHEVGSGSRGV